MTINEGTIHVLYDRDCGFCRWSVAQLLRLDAEGALDPVAIQSPEGQLLLAGMPAGSQLSSAHTVAADGSILSGGDAAPAIASAIRLVGRPMAAFAGLSPPLTRRAYRFVAENRTTLGRLVSGRRREEADRLLAARSRPKCR